MSWSKFDDAAPKSPKAVAAGNEAWGLWAAAVMYCNRHNTDGYVTLAALAVDCLPRPIPLAKARKLADELLNARLRPEGKGLFELDRNDMYRVHDFLDWNPSKVEVESKRKLDRDRKRGGRGVDADSERNPRGLTSGGRADSVPPRASPVPSRPDLSRPDPDESTRALAPDEQSTWDGSERETACPLDIAQRAKALGIPQKLAGSLKADLGSVEALIHDFASYWTIGGGMGQKRRHWMRKLRENVRKEAGKPGGLPAPGAVDHSNLTRESRIALKEIDRVEQGRVLYEAEKQRRAAADGQ
jgi:hypothetical protein